MSSSSGLLWKRNRNHGIQLKGNLGYFTIIPTRIPNDHRKLHARSYNSPDSWARVRASFQRALFSTFGGVALSDCTWYVIFGARVAGVGFPCAVTRVQTKDTPRGRKHQCYAYAEDFSAITTILQLLASGLKSKILVKSGLLSIFIQTVFQASLPPPPHQSLSLTTRIRDTLSQGGNGIKHMHVCCGASLSSINSHTSK